MPNESHASRHSRGIANEGARYLLIATLVVGLLAGLGAITPRASASGSPPELDGFPASGWIPDVPVAADSVFSESNPSVTTAANGNLYMAYQSNAAGSYDIYFTESSDDGLTWSPPVPVVATGTNEVTPSIAQDPYTGRTFVAYRFGTSGATPIRAAYSDDLVTWFDRTVLPCGVACERPRIVSEYWRGASNVQYVALAGPISANDWNVAIARSLDDGNTWTWYESGLGPADVRYQPDVAVQRGTDGVDRVFVFYRGGAAFPPSTGYVEWSTNYGASYQPRATWYSNVYSPPAVAAAHDGTSLLVTYSTNTPQVVWAQAPYPQNLASFNGTWDFLPTAGTQPAVSASGTGSNSTAIGGDYHVIAHDTAGALFHVQAPVTLTSNADWSASNVFTDVGAVPSSGSPDLAITTQDRGGTWYPAVLWTDDRGGTPDVYYTTPGTTGALGVTLDTTPAGLRVTFDGVTRTAPATFWVSGGLHTISVPSPQAGAPGWQHYFSSWSDGGAISHVINVTAPVAINATFWSQVYLTVNSANGGVTGAGWYNQGAVATFSVTSPQAGPTGWQYRFTDWSGDVVSTALSATVTMDAPKTVNANWQTQVYLTVQSPYGGVSGAGWYDLGSMATITATGPQPGPTGVQYTFAAWTGDISSTSATEYVTMNEPRTVTSLWQTWYYLTVNAAHGNVTASGWYPAGTVVAVRVQATEVVEGGTTWQFSGWSGGATGTAATVNVTMTGPKTVTANWAEKPGLIGGTGVLLIGIIALVLALLLIIGMIMRRRRKPVGAYPPMPMPTAPVAAPPYVPPQEAPPQAPTQPPADPTGPSPPPSS